MEKMKLWVLATILGCGACVFSACEKSDDDNDMEDFDTDVPMGVYVPDIGFNPIDCVLAEVNPNERVVFLLRHAERGWNYSRTGTLTENGKKQAQTVGERIKSDEVAFYAHSDYIRTKQTCQNIAIGRGSEDVAAGDEEWGILSGEWYEKDHGVVSKNGWSSWENVSQWEYEGGFEQGYYNLADRSEEWLDSLRAHLPTMRRLNILVSHDLMVSAMTVYLTNGMVDLRYWQTKKWLNYLAGIAIIIDPQGNMRFRTVRGLDSGVMK
ncbi:MAG: histidine phosphatase family protein [Bacteroidaceae bacterium]|nr:histidine phosphatase family protein [Bacteroidaceae bacterium]